MTFRSTVRAEITKERPDENVAFLSVIVPIYNEEDSLIELCRDLHDVLTKLGNTFEIILINDGSIDRSWEMITKIAMTQPHVVGLELRRNYGQTAALMAGIDHAGGDIILAIDADLQNDPRDIPRLLEKLAQGYDVVSGWRRSRKDASLRRNFVSRVANALISRISGVHLHDYGCTLKAYRRDVIKEVRLYGEMHRFIPIYASWLGAKVCEIPVQHHARRFGQSKYGLNRTIKVTLDLLLMKFLDQYFVKPIYIFGGFGILAIAISLLAVGVALYWKLFEGLSMIQTPMPILAAMSFLVGVVSILMGLLAEMLMRTYFESQQRSAYLIRRVVGRDAGD